MALRMKGVGNEFWLVIIIIFGIIAVSIALAVTFGLFEGLGSGVSEISSNINDWLTSIRLA